MKLGLGIIRSRVWESFPENGTVPAVFPEKQEFFHWQGICHSYHLMNRLRFLNLASRALFAKWVFACSLLLGLISNPLIAEELHLGGKNLPAQGLSEIEVPLYLTNFEEITINSVAFELNWDEALLELETVAIDTTKIRGLELTQLSRPSPGNAIIRLTATQELKDAWFELAFANFRLKETPASNETFISFDSVRVNETGGAFTQSTPFALDYSRSQPLKGDLNNDGKLDMEDVRELFTKITDTKPLSINEFDLDANGIVETMDAALLYRHAIGLLPDLQSYIPQIKNDVNLDLKDMEASFNGWFKFEVQGENVEGLQAMELSFDIPPQSGKPTIISASGFGGSSELIHFQLFTDTEGDRKLLVYLVSPEKVKAQSERVLTFFVQFENTPDQFAINTTWLNGGYFTDPTLLTQTLDKLRNETPSTTTILQSELKMEYKSPRLYFKTAIGERARLQILNAKGAIVKAIPLNKGAQSVSLEGLRPGKYIIVLMSNKHNQLIGKQVLFK